MATATHAGPIGIDQLNTTFYVWGLSSSGGEAGFETIQAAVDYVRTYHGGSGTVEVVHGHGYGEDISKITGGNAFMYILDNRDEKNQRYKWNGTQFVPADFSQLQGYITYGRPTTYPGSISMGFDPAGTAGTGDGNIGVTATATGAGLPSINFNLGSSDGITQSIDIMRLGADSSGNPATTINATLSVDRSIFVGPEMRPGIRPLTLDAKGNADGSNRAVRLVSVNPTDINYAGAIGLEGYSTDFSNDVQYLTCINNSIVGVEVTVGGNLKVNGVTRAGLLAASTLNFWFFVGQGQFTTIQKAVDAAVAVGEGEVIVPWDYAGSDTIAAITGGIGNVIIKDHREASAQPYVWWNGQYIPSDITQQGNVTIDGFLHVGRALTADSASFVTCEVDNSPVRTFANSQDGGGTMEWPPAGIGVSTGTAWGTSINPATIPRLNAANTFTADQTINGNATVNGNISAGHYLSAGAANDPSAAAGSYGCYLYNDSSAPIYTKVLCCGDSGSRGVFQVVGIGRPGGLTAKPYLTCADGTVTAEESFNCAGNIYASGTITSIGDASINGNAYVTGHISINSAGSIGNLPVNQVGLTIGYNLTGYQGVSFVNGVSQYGGFDWYVVTVPTTLTATPLHRVMAIDGGNGLLLFNINDATNTPKATIDPNGNASFTGTLHCDNNFSVGPGSVFNVTGTAINAWGLVTCNQGLNVAGGSKNFVITHPLDETKDLYHSCLEGPEIAVYYRGEAQVVDGYAVVTLPDYFEALTYPEDRSVQLTQVWEDVPVFARLAASRVVYGQFTIHATDDVTVMWEVKAVRRIGVERLAVVQEKAA